ncbi:hypothetical protein U1Q18_040998 [Sarracenia purpurea var. burkii]
MHPLIINTVNGEQKMTILPLFNIAPATLTKPTPPVRQITSQIFMSNLSGPPHGSVPPPSLTSRSLSCMWKTLATPPALAPSSSNLHPAHLRGSVSLRCLITLQPRELVGAY